MRRWMTAALKRASSRVFHLSQRAGLDVLPRHFYSEIPDISRLKQTRSWRQPYTMAGVAGADVDRQLAFVAGLFGPEVRDRLLKDDVYARACADNGAEGFGRVEADVLYAFIRAYRPPRVVQIGCGVSTAVILAAAADAGYQPRVQAVDPFPTDYLRRLAARGAIELLAAPVEDVPRDRLVDLGRGDLFFVDSTHTLGPAGEVTRIVLEFLPRLASGLVVHIHDIYFPYDYPTDTLDAALFFPHESALVHAFLTGNTRAEILASLSMLHHARSSALQPLIASYRPRPMQDGLSAGDGHFPSSLYIAVVGDGGHG